MAYPGGNAKSNRKKQRVIYQGTQQRMVIAPQVVYQAPVQVVQPQYVQVAQQPVMYRPIQPVQMVQQRVQPIIYQQHVRYAQMTQAPVIQPQPFFIQQQQAPSKYQQLKTQYQNSGARAQNIQQPINNNPEHQPATYQVQPKQAPHQAPPPSQHAYNPWYGQVSGNQEQPKGTHQHTPQHEPSAPQDAANLQQVGEQDNNLLSVAQEFAPSAPPPPSAEALYPSLDKKY